MKITRTEDSYRLEAETKKDNNVIAVLVALIEFPKGLERFNLLEGCELKEGKHKNYMEIPLYSDWINSFRAG